MGMKISDLANRSKRLRSASTATIKPKATAPVAPKMIHRMLLKKAVCMLRSVKTAR